MSWCSSIDPATITQIRTNDTVDRQEEDAESDRFVGMKLVVSQVEGQLRSVVPKQMDRTKPERAAGVGGGEEWEGRPGIQRTTCREYRWGLVIGYEENGRLVLCPGTSCGRWRSSSNLKHINPAAAEEEERREGSLEITAGRRGCLSDWGGDA